MTARRYGTYAVMAWLAELDLTAMWGDGNGAKSRAATSRAVLQTVANFVNEDNAYWGGNEKISAHCDNRSKQTIQDHLERAAQVGILSKQRVMLGTRRGKDRITFHVGLTQEQLLANTAANPWAARARKESTETKAEALGQSASARTIAELEAEVARLRDASTSAESRERMTVIPSQNDAELPVDNSADDSAVKPAEGMPGHPFRRDDGSSLPLVTTPINHSSSSGSEVTYGARTNDEDEDDDSNSVGSVIDESLRKAHPGLSLDGLIRRLSAQGVAADGIDLVGAAREVLAARIGHRIGDPTAYVATSIVREPGRWLAVGQNSSWEQLVNEAAQPSTPAERCAAGEHKRLPDSTCLWCDDRSHMRGAA